MSQPRFAVAIVLLALAAGVFFTAPAIADSNVRIVRISYIDGDAQIDQSNDSDGFTHAVLNMPVTSGMWLYTPNSGRAEVQFENGSTVRLVDDAQIQFGKLALASSGGTIDVINIDHGVAYFNFEKVKSDDKITINAGGRLFQVTKTSHFRVAADDKATKLAVLHGEVLLVGDNPVEVKSHETLTLSASSQKPEVAKEIDKLGSDDWDKDRETRVEVAENNKRPFSYPDAMSAEFDSMSAYGNFMMLAGYGYAWQPFGVGMAWDPFMNGIWSYYPGFGYAWVSPYPWGWAPYRYGQWSYIGGTGWVWLPGNNFTAWNVGPRIGTMPAGYHSPVAPVTPVGKKPVPVVAVGNPPGVHPAILAGHAVVENHPNLAAKRFANTSNVAVTGSGKTVPRPPANAQNARATNRTASSSGMSSSSPSFHSGSAVGSSSHPAGGGGGHPK